MGHSCALLTGGSVDCWGLNSNGQLGTGDMNDKHTPTGVTGLGAGGQEMISFFYVCPIKYFGMTVIYNSPPSLLHSLVSLCVVIAALVKSWLQLGRQQSITVCQ